MKVAGLRRGSLAAWTGSEGTGALGGCQEMVQSPQELWKNRDPKARSQVPKLGALGLGL